MPAPQKPRSRSVLSHLGGVAFWVPLPLIGLGIWVGGRAIADQMLGYAYDTNTYLEADTEIQIQLEVSILAIEAEIKPEVGFTKVSVKTADSAIKTLELELPTLETDAIETGIAQELSLDVNTIRHLTRYQLE